MAEFQDNLGAPGDYQRPVATKGGSVDIFGAAADLWNTLGSGSSKGGPSDAEIRAERTAQGLDAFAAGASAIMANQSEGPGANVLSFFGADAKPMFDEMKRVNTAAEDGEISSVVREVQLEKLVAGVMGKYPEASYEIMGQALSGLGIDHAFGRAYKANIAAQDAAEKDMIAAQSEAYKVGAGAGITGPYEYVVSQGKVIQQQQFNQKRVKDYLDIKKVVDDQRIAMTKAQRDALVTQQKILGQSIVGGYITATSTGAGPLLETLANMQQAAGSDPKMNEEYNKTLQTARNALMVEKQKRVAELSSLGLDPVDIEPYEKNMDAQIKSMDDFVAGALSNDKTILSMHNIIKNKSGIEDGQIAPVYQQMVKAFGAPLIHGILDGSLQLEGVTADDLDFLVKDLSQGFSKGQLTFEEAQKKLAAAQSALSGTDISKLTNEADRKEITNKSFLLLAAATKTMYKGDMNAPAGPQEIKNFQGASLSLASAVMEDAPTITNENLKKIAPSLFSGMWRGAIQKALDGGDQDAAVKNIQYNTVVAAKVLENYQKRYVDTGEITWDQTRQTYVPKSTPATTNAGTTMAGGADFVYVPASGPSAESVEAASLMNTLLGHLAAVDDMIEVVPDESLQTKTTGADGTTEYDYMSVKDVFATDGGFVKSLANFEQFRPDPEVSTTVSQKFFELAAAKQQQLTESMQPGNTLFDYSQVGQSNEMVLARLNAAEITLGAQRSGGGRIVPKDMKTYMMSMHQTEGPNIKPGAAHDLTRSSASGRYGFLDGTWDTMLKKVDPATANLSPQQRKELMKDPVIEDKVMELFTLENIQALKQATGKTPSWDEVNMAHLLGAQGALKFIDAISKNPFARAKDVLSADVVAANPELTKGTLLDLWNMRLKKKDTGWEDYMSRRHDIETAPIPQGDNIVDFSDDALLEIFGLKGN